MIQTICPDRIYCRPDMMLASAVRPSLGDPDRDVRHSSSWGGGAARVDLGRGVRHLSSGEGSLHHLVV